MTANLESFLLLHGPPINAEERDGGGVRSSGEVGGVKSSGEVGRVKSSGEVGKGGDEVEEWIMKS